jgi:hypothetical protein
MMGIASLNPTTWTVGWVERSETHHLALDDMMGIASLNPSYDRGASASALRIRAQERMPL